MRKRFFILIALVCCLVLAAGILAACNNGESTQTGGQTPGGEGIEPARLIFEKTENGYSVTGYEGAPTVVVIPETYEGLPVTSIGEWAFGECFGLTSVVIPDSVTSIGDYAFYNCSGLTSVTIPDSVTSIGYGAFDGCSNITSATMPTLAIDRIPTSNLQTVVLTGGGSIDDYAFYECSHLTSVTIGEGVTSIGDYAFASCTGLTSVTIGEGVTSIGNYAFEGCTGLTSIYYTGDIASWCGITGLENIMLGRVPRSAALHIDGKKLAGDVIIPEGVTAIPSYAFAYQTGITSVTIPDSVTSIGESAFGECIGLTSVTIGEGVTSIGEYAFYGCSGLTSVTIPDSVTSIWAGAFFGCTGLTSVTIPDSVTSIEWYAFAFCFGLTSVTFEGTVEEWNAIEKGTDWNLGCPFTEVVYSGRTVSVEKEQTY